MPELSFFIEGRPAPGGSKSAFVPTNKKTGQPFRRPGGSIIVNVTDAGGEANKRWKAAVAIQARAFMRNTPPFECPCEWEFVFYIRRPQSHYRTGQNSHLLRDDAPPFHVFAPDVLKFARSTEDGLTGVIWKDDSQCVKICAMKQYVRPHEKEGCAVRIRLLRSEPIGAVTQPA